MYSLKKPTLDTSKQRINEVKKTSLHSLELGETLHLDQAKELDLPEEHPLGNNISPAHIFTVRAFKSHGTSNEKKLSWHFVWPNLSWLVVALAAYKLLLVGGWTNPSEKYARQIGFIFPKVRDEHKKIFELPPRFPPNHPF